MENTKEARARLEAMTLRMFSLFFSVMAVLVLIGPLWSRERPTDHAPSKASQESQVAPPEKRATTTASVITGAVFLSIAGGMYFFSQRIRRAIAAGKFEASDAKHA